MKKVMGSNKKAFKQLFFMIMLTLIIQAITLTKLSVITSNFGATINMDAFNLSNSIGTFIFSFIGIGITTVLIPALVNKKPLRSVNNLLYLACVIIVFIVVLTNLMRDIIYRYFYAKCDTKTTLYNSVIASVLNFVLIIILVKFIGIYVYM